MHTTNDTINEKKQIRKSMLEKRRAIKHKDLISVSKTITNKLSQIFKKINPKRVHIYIAQDNEIETKFFIKEFINEIDFFTPEVNHYKKNIQHKKINTDLSLSIKALEDIEDLDIIVLPGLAFDKDLMRLGYGGGFYDKFLSNKNCLKIGLCHNFQIIDKVPIWDNDEKIDILITEKQIIE